MLLNDSIRFYRKPKTKYMKKRAALIIFGLMLFLSLAYSLPEVIAFGQVSIAPITPPNIVNKPLPTVRAAPNIHELTAVDVETFLDEIVPLQLDREDVAGATIAVVNDGKQWVGE